MIFIFMRFGGAFLLVKVSSTIIKGFMQSFTVSPVFYSKVTP